MHDFDIDKAARLRDKPLRHLEDEARKRRRQLAEEPGDDVKLHIETPNGNPGLVSKIVRDGGKTFAVGRWGPTGNQSEFRLRCHWRKPKES